MKPFTGKKMSTSDYERESEDVRTSSNASDTPSEEPFVNEPSFSVFSVTHDRATMVVHLLIMVLKKMTPSCARWSFRGHDTGCVWKRPTLRFVTRQVNLYVREAVFKEIVDTLSGMGRNSTVGDRAIESLTTGVLGRLMKVRRTGSTNTALHHLIARQLEGDQIPPDESWFQVCGRTIRFTACDFAMITGLHFGNSTFHPDDDHLLQSDGIFHRILYGKNIKVSVLRKRFNARDFGRDIRDYVKVANLLIYYYFVICRDDMLVERWAWALVEDFEQWDMFPWGSYAYGVLSYYIGNVAMKEGQEHKDYHFYDPVWALHIWSYEMIPALGKMCGIRDKSVQVLRCLMWTTRKIFCDFTSFFDDTVHKFIKVVSTQSTSLC
ncbi:hypothetical protein OROMI_033458 [Orobanche minor]